MSDNIIYDKIIVHQWSNWLSIPNYHSYIVNKNGTLKPIWVIKQSKNPKDNK